MTVELKDAKGFTVKLNEKPERIISLSPAVTEILFELNLQDKIVGVTPYCVRPEKAKEKKKVGSYGYARIDLLEQLKPDIILTVTGYQDNILQQLRPKFNVFAFELPSTLPGIIDLVARVGIVVGEHVKARELEIDLIHKINGLKSFKGESVYIELDLGGPVTFGMLSYITDSLVYMGLDPIYKNTPKEWVTPDFRYIQKMDPDIIIFEPKMFSKRDDTLMEKIIEERGWNNLRAYRNKKIFFTPGTYDFFAHHGPSFINEVLPWLSSKSTK